MNVMTRMLIGSAAAAAVSLLSAAPALAHHCTNASKPPGAGVQIIFDNDDNVVWVSKGLQSRIDRGAVDLESGEGFSGLIGFDTDGDGDADLSTYIVGPEGQIPERAQEAGKPCHGITNFEIYFTQCVQF